MATGLEHAVQALRHVWQLPGLCENWLPAGWSSCRGAARQLQPCVPDSPSASGVRCRRGGQGETSHSSQVPANTKAEDVDQKGHSRADCEVVRRAALFQKVRHAVLGSIRLSLAATIRGTPHEKLVSRDEGWTSGAEARQGLTHTLPRQTEEPTPREPAGPRVLVPGICHNLSSPPPGAVLEGSASRR